MTFVRFAHPNLCILNVVAPLFTPIQTRLQQADRKRSRTFAIAVLCLALLALLAFAQVTHTHPANTDADHCPLCIVMHSASPVAATAALIILIQVALASPVLKVRGISRIVDAKLFTRPPPTGC